MLVPTISKSSSNSTSNNKERNEVDVVLTDDSSSESLSFIFNFDMKLETNDQSFANYYNDDDDETTVITCDNSLTTESENNEPSCSSFDMDEYSSSCEPDDDDDDGLCRESIISAKVTKLGLHQQTHATNVQSYYNHNVIKDNKPSKVSFGTVTIRRYSESMVNTSKHNDPNIIENKRAKSFHYTTSNTPTISSSFNYNDNSVYISRSDAVFEVLYYEQLRKDYKSNKKTSKNTIKQRKNK